MSLHVRFGAPEVRMPIDTDEQREAAMRGMADAGVYCAQIWAGDVYQCYSLWADEGSWRGWTISRVDGRCFVERDGWRVEVEPSFLGNVRCAIDAIVAAEDE